MTPFAQRPAWLLALRAAFVSDGNPPLIQTCKTVRGHPYIFVAQNICIVNDDPGSPSDQNVTHFHTETWGEILRWTVTLPSPFVGCYTLHTLWMTLARTHLMKTHGTVFPLFVNILYNRIVTPRVRLSTNKSMESAIMSAQSSAWKNLQKKDTKCLRISVFFFFFFSLSKMLSGWDLAKILKNVSKTYPKGVSYTMWNHFGSGPRRTKTLNERAIRLEMKICSGGWDSCGKITARNSRGTKK